MSKDLDRVVFVSVIHTDTESVERARETVIAVQPDVVAVELDHQRYQQLISPDKTMENWVPPSSGDAAQDLIQQMAILEKSLGEMTGSNVGEEMLAAIEEGRKIDAKIALVDRPIQATMQAISRVPLDEIYRLMGVVPDVKKDLQEGEGTDILGMLKEDGAIENLMKDFNSEYPGLADALIHQRDLYVANALMSILKDVSGKIVAVLGAGHIDGVKKALTNLLESQAAS
ncbi:MAG: TraB domain-containing protein [Candidatus Thorarchaeota archaeon]